MTNDLDERKTNRKIFLLLQTFLHSICLAYQGEKESIKTKNTNGKI